MRADRHLQTIAVCRSEANFRRTMSLLFLSLGCFAIDHQAERCSKVSAVTSGWRC